MHCQNDFFVFNVGKCPTGIKSKDFAGTCTFLAESIKTSNLDATVAINNVKILLLLNFNVMFSMECCNILQGRKKSVLGNKRGLVIFESAFSENHTSPEILALYSR